MVYTTHCCLFPLFSEVRDTSHNGNMIKLPADITDNDHSFGCPIIYMDSIHNAIFWFMDTSTMLDTRKLIH